MIKLLEARAQPEKKNPKRFDLFHTLAGLLHVLLEHHDGVPKTGVSLPKFHVASGVA